MPTVPRTAKPLIPPVMPAAPTNGSAQGTTSKSSGVSWMRTTPQSPPPKHAPTTVHTGAPTYAVPEALLRLMEDSDSDDDYAGWVASLMDESPDTDYAGWVASLSSAGTAQSSAVCPCPANADDSTRATPHSPASATAEEHPAAHNTASPRVLKWLKRDYHRRFDRRRSTRQQTSRNPARKRKRYETYAAGDTAALPHA